VYHAGEDYTGSWPANNLLVIEIANASGAAPPLIAAPYSASDNRRYHLEQVTDLRGFQVQWTETCSTPACNPRGDIKYESFEALEDALPLYHLMLRGEVDPTIFDTIDLPCTYTRVPRGLISNVVIVHQGVDLRADFWVYVKPEGKLRDVRNTETFANFSTLTKEGMQAYAGAQGITPTTHDSIQVPLTGDFGRADVAITSLVISDPDNQDTVYGEGDEIEVKFSHKTNMAHMKAGDVVGKDVVNALLTCDSAEYQPGPAAWSECSRLIVAGAGAAISGIYAVELDMLDGRPYYRQGNGGNYYIYSYCNSWEPARGCPRWLIGSVPGSVAAAFYSESGADPSRAAAGSWRQWDGGEWVRSGISVTCSEGGAEDIVPDSTFNPFLEAATMQGSCDVLGIEYTGTWRDRQTFIISIVNATGLVGYYDAVLVQTCTPRPACAVVSINAPRVASFFVRIKPSAWLRNFPETSGAVGHTNPALQYAVSPPLLGDYGVMVPRITRVVASDPDNADHVYGTGDKITIYFFQPTDLAGFAECDADAQLSDGVALSERYCCSYDVCEAPVLSKQDLSSIFIFSQLLGNNYTGRWLLKGTALEITIDDAEGSTVPDNMGPPFVGGFVVWPETTKGRYIRSADGKSEPASLMSPVLEGSFGPEIIRVVSLTASDPDDSDPAYDVGDAITLQFSEKTNKGELPDKKVSKDAIDALLEFNMPLGDDYQGDWMTCDTLRISVLNTSGAPPPALGLLTVRVLPGGGLRNWPPASAPSTHAYNGTLRGPLELVFSLCCIGTRSVAA
jgi:hypothetical protein